MQISKYSFILTGLFYCSFSSTFWPVPVNLPIRDQTESGFILTGAHPCASLTTDPSNRALPFGLRGILPIQAHAMISRFTMPKSPRIATVPPMRTRRFLYEL